MATGIIIGTLPVIDASGGCILITIFNNLMGSVPHFQKIFAWLSPAGNIGLAKQFYQERFSHAFHV
jgi:hypothetical protein